MSSSYVTHGLRLIVPVYHGAMITASTVCHGVAPVLPGFDISPGSSQGGREGSSVYPGSSRFIPVYQTGPQRTGELNRDSEREHSFGLEKVLHQFILLTIMHYA